jgi:hypothetical protein
LVILEGLVILEKAKSKKQKAPENSPGLFV